MASKQRSRPIIIYSNGSKMSKFTIKIIIFTIMAIFVSGSFFIIPAKAQAAP